MVSAATASPATPGPRAARWSTTSTSTSPPAAGDPGPGAPQGLSGRAPGPGRRRSAHRPGRVRRAHRLQRSGEVHAAALPQRARGPDRRRGRGGRHCGHRGRARVAPDGPVPGGLRVPAVQPAAPADRARQRGARATAARVPLAVVARMVRRSRRGAGARDPRARGPGRPGRAERGHPVRRPAAAGGHRPRPRAGARGHPGRRADGEPRPRALAHRDGAAAPDQPRGRHHGGGLAPRAGAGPDLRTAHRGSSARPRGARRPARLARPRGGRRDLRLRARGRRIVTRATRLAGWAALVAVFVWSAVATEVSLGRMVDGLPYMWDFLRRMVPPDLSVLGNALRGAIETIQIAIVGTTVAAVLALPVGFAAARNASPRWLFYSSRLLLNAFRAVDTLVYALFFVAAVGLGPFPGVLAVIVYTATVLAKLYSEAIEAIDPGPVEAVLATGAGRLQVLRWGVLPQLVPQFLSFTLYRFETNIRAAAILGFVGAGGIGFYVQTYLRLLNYPAAASVLLVLVALVMAVDFASSRLRARLV